MRISSPPLHDSPPIHTDDNYARSGFAQTVSCDCPEICGDGHLVGAEACDDGDSNVGDGCSSACAIEDGWDCTGETAQQSTCDAHECGDGVRTGAEECDDGNTDDYDGCDASCDVEDYWSCPNDIGELSVCECMRVRKDWRDMRGTLGACAKDSSGAWSCGASGDAAGYNERATYIEAVLTMKDTIAPNGYSLYDNFVTIHETQANKDYAHGTSGFLPWHRKYLLEYEESLRSLDKRFACATVPYWDWAEDTDICAAQGGCATYADNENIVSDLGGAGDATCATSGAGDVECASVATANGMASSTVTTHGSSGAPAVECGWWERWQGTCTTEVPANAVACVTSGPFANWLSPDWPETRFSATDSTITATQTTKCLSRGVNWDVGAQGALTGSVRLREIITSNTAYGGAKSGTNGFRAFLESTPHAASRRVVFFLHKPDPAVFAVAFLLLLMPGPVVFDVVFVPTGRRCNSRALCLLAEPAQPARRPYPLVLVAGRPALLLAPRVHRQALGHVAELPQL